MKVVITLWNDSPHTIERWQYGVWLCERSNILEIPDSLAEELFKKQEEMELFQDELRDLACSEAYPRFKV